MNKVITTTFLDARFIFERGTDNIYQVRFYQSALNYSNELTVYVMNDSGKTRIFNQVKEPVSTDTARHYLQTALDENF